MKDTRSRIISNVLLKGNYHYIKLDTGWRSFSPGQFVMVGLPGNSTLLRRPFGIVRLENGSLELCYKVVGKGTDILKGLNQGEYVNVLGPLGNGFELKKGNVNLLVAGGYGIAPLYGLAEKLAGEEVHLFYGAKNEEHLLLIDKFKKLKVKLHIATEDGSIGEKGLITDLLSKFLRVGCDSRFTIYGCGPDPMLKAVADLSKPMSAKVKCQLSLESYMACGIGVCVGCVVKDNEGNYVRVCKEGPVFNAEELSI